MKKISYLESTITAVEFANNNGKQHLVTMIQHWYKRLAEVGLNGMPVIPALLIYGEARGEGTEGQKAVLQVLYNRCIRRKMALLESEALRKWQFSCFNLGDKALSQAVTVTSGVAACYASFAQTVIKELAEGKKDDRIKDATMYCTSVALRTQIVRWANQEEGAWDFRKVLPVTHIGKHYFMKEL